ncbi:hypothetical protein OG225_21225 [Nocardia sp. NBC_01377]|uniref:hypothetical protein n=1 Tax=Nocardia sp. NBC_01377 TaxID=2903595 RepID=UPI0032553F57
MPPIRKADARIDTPADGPEAAAPPHDLETHDTTSDGGKPDGDGPRLSLIGPTSEATRRLVAESRARQGLTPYVNDPHVIESLALFLRNAIDTLDSEGRRDDV